MEMKTYTETLIRVSEEKSIKSDDDYIGEDGLLDCGKCHTRKQYRLVNGGKEYVVPVLCKCGAEQRDREEVEFKRRERMAEIKRRKAACIHDSSLLYATFENDDGTVPMMRAARKYVDTWQIRKENNDGLLLYGEVGTGKTFFAGCIANALIEQGVSVLMTNFAKILNSVTGMYSEERNNFIASLMRYNLLIIDDLGIERNSEFALEQIYNVIDERYKTRLPLIVTTNLSLKTLENPKDVAHQRIYDRVLSMCTPVRFVGTSHRKMDAMKKHKALADLFEEK